MDAKPILISGVSAAKCLGIGKSLFYQLDASGALPAPVRLHGKRLWSVELLKLWANNGAPGRDSTEWAELKETCNKH